MTFGSNPVLLVWILAFLLLYWGYCLFWAARRAPGCDTAAGYFIAGRSLGPWAFACGATVATLAGWLFAAAPGLLLRDGFPAAYLGLSTVAVSVAGAALLRRQWILGRRRGYVTAGEMLDEHFSSDVIRLASVGVALLFALPFTAMLLRYGADTLAALSGGALGGDGWLWVLAAPVVICATAGGLGGVANAGRLQIILIVTGFVLLGLFVLHLCGGFEAMSAALERAARLPTGLRERTGGFGGGDFVDLFAVSGVAQWSEGLGSADIRGGPWTGLLILSFVLTVCGVVLSPASTMLAFSAREAEGFAPQLTWAGAGVFGLVLIGVMPIIGLGAVLLGASGEATAAGVAVAALLPDLDGGREALLPAALLALLGRTAPAIAAIAAVAVVIAATAPVGAFLHAAGAALARDVYRHFFARAAEDRVQKRFARVAVLLLAVGAVLMASRAERGAAALAAFALPAALQLLPAYLGLLWLPWLTRAGVVAGLLVGLAVAMLTDPIGQLLAAGGLPWGPWPWTIHAGGWGLAANLLVAVLGSALDRRAACAPARERTRAELASYAPRPPADRALVSATWCLALAWVFFAVGPGAVIGNYAFGEPGGEGRNFAMPSIWAWQLIAWSLGVLLVWLLAYGLRLATAPADPVVAIRADVARDPLHEARRPA